MNNDYYNYAMRHMELLSSMLQQLDTLNQNMAHMRPQNSTTIPRQPPPVGRRRTTRATRPYASRTYIAHPPPPTNAYDMPVVEANAAAQQSQDNSLNRLATNILNSLFWDPVAIFPTEAEIRNATSSITYNELSDDTTSCPITLEPFTENSEIMRINRCGHCFIRSGILRWFRNHVSCPVCRHDIRNNTSPPAVADGDLPSPPAMSANNAEVGGTIENNDTMTYHFDFMLAPNNSTDTNE